MVTHTDPILQFQFEMSFEEYESHSMAVRNLRKVWKTEMGPSKDDSKGLLSELFEILQNRDHC